MSMKDQLKPSVSIFWFRRDLRLEDNAGLYHALRGDRPVVPIFIFDRNILDKLEDKADRRVEFIHRALEDMQRQLIQAGSSLQVFYGSPAEIFRRLLTKYQVGQVFTNTDYEPYARERDAEVAGIVADAGGSFHPFKDQVIFEKDEVVKDDGKPYTVFTPYSKRWKALLNDFYQTPYPVERYFSNFYRQAACEIPSLLSMGFKPCGDAFPPNSLREDLLLKYAAQRDFPGIGDGTSRMGVHLRFGTCSIRDLVRRAGSLSETYLNELIWRNFTI